jgi:hypothetical protein
MKEGHYPETQCGPPLLALGKSAERASRMDHGASLARVTAIAVAACLVACLGSFSALGNSDPPFAYDFGSAKRPAGYQDPHRSDIASAIFPNVDTAWLAEYVMPQRMGVERGAYGIAFGYEAPVDDSLPPLSLSQIAESIVAEPSTILGGIAAAGLILAFLVLRWRENGSSAAVSDRPVPH